MTEDTKRALKAITPMAEQLGIRVTADDKFLYCNGQAIGIGCNSAYATIKEFIGYVFVTVYKKDVFDLHGEALPAKVLNRIKEFWFTKQQLEKFREASME